MIKLMRENRIDCSLIKRPNEYYHKSINQPVVKISTEKHIIEI